jgi:hypothetical protein
MIITIDNICAICEKQGCDEPCDTWYECLQGKPVDFGFIE